MGHPSADPTRRFSDRVENYVRYRPRYPAGLLPLLAQHIDLTPEWTIADVGSGTGISCEPFLKNGNRVSGIEPNADMRAVAERLLALYANFHSVNGTAEHTILQSGSIELVTAMQAFHWFDPAPTAAEFARILKPGGWVVLVWNERRTDSSPFLREYEALILKHGTDYGTVRHENVTDERLRAFFGNDDYQKHILPNEQRFDYAGLRARLESSSYAPPAGTPGHESMIADLEHLFARQQRGGQVVIDYDTRIYCGRIRNRYFR